MSLAKPCMLQASIVPGRDHCRSRSGKPEGAAPPNPPLTLRSQPLSDTRSNRAVSKTSSNTHLGNSNQPCSKVKNAISRFVSPFPPCPPPSLEAMRPFHERSSRRPRTGPLTTPQCSTPYTRPAPLSHEPVQPLTCPYSHVVRPPSSASLGRVPCLSC